MGGFLPPPILNRVNILCILKAYQPPKNLYYHILAYSKQIKTIQTPKIIKHLLTIFSLIMQNFFLLQDNVILLCLESLKEWFYFHDLNFVLKCRHHIFLFLIYNTLRAIAGFFLLNPAFLLLDSKFFH